MILSREVRYHVGSRPAVVLETSRIARDPGAAARMGVHRAAMRRSRSTSAQSVFNEQSRRSSMCASRADKDTSWVESRQALDANPPSAKHASSGQRLRRCHAMPAERALHVLVSCYRLLFCL
jgi:hypothetical protein